MCSRNKITAERGTKVSRDRLGGAAGNWLAHLIAFQLKRMPRMAQPGRRRRRAHVDIVECTRGRAAFLHCTT